jgi:hypothetical protein
MSRASRQPHKKKPRPPLPANVIPFPDRGRPAPAMATVSDEELAASLGGRMLDASAGGMFAVDLAALGQGPEVLGLVLHKKHAEDVPLVREVLATGTRLATSAMLLAAAAPYRQPNDMLFYELFVPRLFSDRSGRQFERDAASAEAQLAALLDQLPPEAAFAEAWLFQLEDEGPDVPSLDVTIVGAGGGGPVAHGAIASSVLTQAVQLAGPRRLRGLELFKLGYAAALVNEICARLAMRLLPRAADSVSIFVGRDGQEAVPIAEIKRTTRRR